MIDGALMIGVGVFVLLIGLKVIVFPSSAQFNAAAWHAKHDRRFRVFGIGLVVIGAVLAVADLAAPP